jgi:hypothetical protein
VPVMAAAVGGMALVSGSMGQGSLGNKERGVD